MFPLANTGFFKLGRFAFGNALQFDGVNDRVTAADIVISGASSTRFTISFWSKRVATPTSNIEFFFSTGINTASRLIIQDRQDLSKYRVTINSVSIDFATYITDTDWHHYFFVYDGNEMLNIDRFKMYIDAVLNIPTTISGVIPTSIIQSSLRFPVIGGNQGANTAGTLRYYTGVMDEFCCWTDFAGTQANAISLYNSGLGNFADLVIPNPERYYKLNGSGSDTIAIDSSPNGNNGTLNNFTGTYWVAH
jgi:hypothetical protein